jgi:hypothetical protein
MSNAKQSSHSASHAAGQSASQSGSKPKLHQASTDGVPEGVDTGNVTQLPGAEGAKPVKSGIPNTLPMTEKSEADQSKKADERAEEVRGLGTGAEPPRFNKGTEEDQ